MIYPDLPDVALSVRQPWAWAIMHAGKDIENRSRRTHFRGRVAIHASKWFNTEEEMEDLRWMRDARVNGEPLLRGVSFPLFKDAAEAFKRGGIIGSVEIVDCREYNSSLWHFGPYGYVLRDPRPCEFIPVKGALGFFPWKDRLI